MSLAGACRDAVLRLGECTIAQVRAEVTKTIPLTQAAAAGRKELRRVAARGKPKRKIKTVPLVERGITALINTTLAKLASRGAIRRVRPGVYAPLLPALRLYESA